MKWLTAVLLAIAAVLIVLDQASKTLVVQWLAGARSVEVWGTGNDIRDLLYVDDFIDGMLAAFATDAPYLAAPSAPRRRNEPAFVGIVARWAAELRGERPEAFGEALVGFAAGKFASDHAAPERVRDFQLP